jgi:predicted transcriptional regulator of viral defense system
LSVQSVRIRFPPPAKSSHPSSCRDALNEIAKGIKQSDILHTLKFAIIANNPVVYVEFLGKNYIVYAIILDLCELLPMEKNRTFRLPRGRVQLRQVLAASGDVIHIADVTKTLTVSRTKAAKRLARWREQGWLRRVGSGAYVSASIDTLGSERVLDDAWVLVPAIFAPAYVAGRTAAEHWDLTEQIFKDVVVVTGQAIRERHQVRQGFDFTLKHLKPEKMFGTKTVWRHKTKVPVSDIHRTIIDMLDDPALGGGIQHVSDCLGAYLNRSDRSDQKLIAYGDQLGNGAVFKRLGFLAERDDDSGGLVELCRARLTAGNAKLDPALDCERIVSRWRLIIPPSWARGAAE